MTYSARVHWRSPGERGRASVPPTLRYVALSRFPEDGPQWPDGAWSIEVLFDVPPPEQHNPAVSEGRVRFLVEQAPSDRLAPGRWFTLYEGLQPVADVEIIEEL
jgi:hypothetical protein